MTYTNKALKKLYSSIINIEESYHNKSKDELYIGVLGNDIPLELLIAADCNVIPVRGERGENFDLINQYLESGFDPKSKMQMLQLINGKLKDLDYLLISNSSDAIIRIYYYLRALKERGYHLPTIEFFDFLHTKSRISSLYNLDRLVELKSLLENWCNKTIANSDIVNAINISNETRQLLLELTKLRSMEKPLVTGTDALKWHLAIPKLKRPLYNQLLREYLEECNNHQSIDGVRIFISGSTHEHTELYEMIEEIGGIIVGEDHEHGLGNYLGEILIVNENPLEGLNDYYHLSRPLSSSQATITERVQNLIHNVTNLRSEGVIFYIHKSDDAPSWDYPEQKKALEEKGIPCLLIDRQSYELVEKEKLKEQIKTFINRIRLVLAKG